MSKAEILAELPKLAPEERREIWYRLGEMNGYSSEDNEADSITDEDIAFYKERLQLFEKDPTSAISLDELNARLNKRFGE